MNVWKRFFLSVLAAAMLTVAAAAAQGIMCWDSLITQLVKNLPAMQETPVRFLGWENPLGKG